MKIQEHGTARPGGGFSLMEILVALAIIATLASIISVGVARMRDRARQAVDITKMREIGHCLFARGMARNGVMYLPEEVGFSLYRQWKDPLSLCQILEREDYLTGEDAWIGPGANERHVKYKNSYCWAINPSITAELTTAEKLQTKMLFWNNYPYTLPSVVNVPESPKGPRPANAQYYYKPWAGKTKYHGFFLDGHIELR